MLKKYIFLAVQRVPLFRLFRVPGDGWEKLQTATFGVLVLQSSGRQVIETGFRSRFGVNEYALCSACSGCSACSVPELSTGQNKGVAFGDGGGMCGTPLARAQTGLLRVVGQVDIDGIESIDGIDSIDGLVGIVVMGARTQWKRLRTGWIVNSLCGVSAGVGRRGGRLRR